MARRTDDGAKEPKAPKVKKQRWYHQVWQAYQMTRRADPAVTWWLLAAFLGIVAVALAIGAWWGHPVYTTLIGVPFGALAAMWILARRTEKAAYQQIHGQPGAALAALRTIRGGWQFTEEPVAFDGRNQDLVFRGVGRPGVVLVSEGAPHRAQRMLEAERKRTARVLPNVPIHLIQSGDEEDQVVLDKLASKVRKLKPTLTKAEVAEVTKRLNALGAARLPVPKGIDLTKARPDRKGLKGR